jgi:hypothetical protein
MKHATLRDVAIGAVRYVVAVFAMSRAGHMADARGLLLENPVAVLPDVGHDLVPFHPELAIAPDLILMLQCLGLIAFCARFKRRNDLILAFVDMHVVMMALRSMCVAITVLPTCVHSCKLRHELGHTRASESLSEWLQNGGMASNCHDLVFSGHAIVYTLMFLLFVDASGAPLFVRLLNFALSVAGVFTLLSSRLHYSLDIFVAVAMTALLYLQWRPSVVEHLRDRDEDEDPNAGETTSAVAVAVVPAMTVGRKSPRVSKKKRLN